MAVQKTWAVYHDGQLQLLDPLELAEGQRVQVTVMDPRSATEAALAESLCSGHGGMGTATPVAQRRFGRGRLAMRVA